MKGWMAVKSAVTIQDIAEALGMSRNTVSKALNGKPVPVKTKNAVISAAIELGYEGCGLAAATAAQTIRGQKRFLILSSRMLMSMNYYIHVLRGIEEDLSGVDAELIQLRVSSPSSFGRVRNYLEENGIDGIICIEFFDTGRIAELTGLGIPLVFIDFPVGISALWAITFTAGRFTSGLWAWPRRFSWRGRA